MEMLSKKDKKLIDKRKPNIILDYDGTFTDIEKSTKDWQKQYPVICSEILEIPYEKIKKDYNDIKNNLMHYPEKGFFIGGTDSLPANADPYIKSQAAMQELIESKKLMTDKKEITNFLIDAYGKTCKISNDKTYFRKDLENFLSKIENKYNVIIVTNSGKEKVEKGLEKLSKEDYVILGNAGKLFVNNSEESRNKFGYNPKNFSSIKKNQILPVATRFPYGKDNMLSPRVVNLRREGYFNILKELAKMGVKPENTQVIGDIFELDLALPLFLGYGGILINNGNALEYEKECNNSKFLYAKNMNNLVKIFFE